MRLILTALLSLLVSVSAQAHSWYPMQCCSDYDCAPVTAIRQVPEGRMVTTTHGTVLVPVDYKDTKPSQDSDFHACVLVDESGGLYLRCFFEPPGS